MKTLPAKPFTTADFSLRGGGIDFLGLRWVNLTIVGRDLIPELNNVTADNHFEFVDEPRDDNAVINALRMIAGWYWRMLVRQQDGKTKNLLSLGGADRMSMSWFLQWLTARKKLPIRILLQEMFSSLIFAQHMRIALARFDGTAQRLRFLIGDSGIEATISARSDLGERNLPWMPDRLDTLAGLLCDCDVLAAKDGDFIRGPAAGEYK